MFPSLVLAESSTLDSLIHGTGLLMGTTVLPALCGLLMLLKTRRPSTARVAFFLGLTTVLLAGGLCGLIYWGDAISDWYKVPVGTLLVGVFVCALAWRLAVRRRGGV